MAYEALGIRAGVLSRCQAGLQIGHLSQNIYHYRHSLQQVAQRPIILDRKEYVQPCSRDTRYIQGIARASALQSAHQRDVKARTAEQRKAKGMSTLLQKEISAPLWPVMTYDMLDQAIGYIEAHDKPLALYMFSDSIENAAVFLIVGC